MHLVGGDLVHFVAHGYWDRYGDARCRSHFLFSYGLGVPVAVLALYLAFVLKVGPATMANRNPFQLKWVLVAYNAAMVAVNGWFFFQLLVWHPRWLAGILDFHYQVDRNDADTRGVIQFYHGYLISKFFDLFDTIFFVLRKKDRQQVTRLHLYHHVSVPLFGWMVLRMNATLPPLFLFVLFNTVIHTIMYSYYALAALGPAIQPYLWWKRYVTQLQIYQFVVYSLYAAVFAVKQRGYPVWIQLLVYTQPAIFLALFIRFYFRSYGQTASYHSQKPEDHRKQG